MSQNFSFRQAAVIGAGTMGRGIVMCLANAGLDVQWLDSNPQMLNQALGAVATPTRTTCARGASAKRKRPRAAPASRRSSTSPRCARRTW